MSRQKSTRRENGQYEYKATVGKTVQGRPIRKSFYSGKSLADAKAKAKKYIEDAAVARVGVIAEDRAPTRFDVWARKWLRVYKKPFVAANTFRLTYENIVEKHLIPYFGAADLHDIRPADVTAFFATKKSCSVDRVKHMKSTLGAIFAAAIENDLCYKNPVSVRTPAKSERAKRKPTIWTDAQMDAARAAWCGEFDSGLVMLETGVRRGELCGLMWQDYDPAARTLRIDRSICVNQGEPLGVRPPKWDSNRILPLSATAIEAIERQPRTSPYIFPVPSGGPQNPNTWAQKFARKMELLPGFPETKPHDLRRTYGTALRRHGADIYTIQKLLGHRDIRVTTEIYVANELDVLRETYDKITTNKGFESDQTRA